MAIQTIAYLLKYHIVIIFVWHCTNRGPRWHSGYGAVLQIGRSLVRSQLVSLEFFIDTILPIALSPWSRLSL
jgi:hypothetical protein